MGLVTHVRDRLRHAVGLAAAPAHPAFERRGPARLKDGSTRPCPSCEGKLEFREAYRIWRTERNTLEPAWVCRMQPCGYREFVRT